MKHSIYDQAFDKDDQPAIVETSEWQPCPQCDGGKKDWHYCLACNGAGGYWVLRYRRAEPAAARGATRWEDGTAL